MKGRIGISALLVGALVFLSTTAPAQGGTRDFLYSKKLYSGLSFVAGVWFLKGAYDARKDGNDAYARYKVAGTPQQARDLYDESKRNDTRSALMLGLGLGTLAYSVHLFLSDDKEELPPPKMQEGLVRVRGVSVDVTGDPVNKGMRLKLGRDF